MLRRIFSLIAIFMMPMCIGWSQETGNNFGKSHRFHWRVGSERRSPGGEPGHGHDRDSQDKYRRTLQRAAAIARRL